MPYFRYKATSPDGSIAGFIRAKNEMDAKQTLASRSYSVTDLRSYHGTPTDINYVMVSDGLASGAKARGMGLYAALGVLLVTVLLGVIIYMRPASKPGSKSLEQKPTPTPTAADSKTITILGTLNIKGTNRMWNPIENMECTFHFPAPQKSMVQTRKIALVAKDGGFNCRVVIPPDAKVVDVVLHLEGDVKSEFEGIPILGDEVKLPLVNFDPER